MLESSPLETKTIKGAWSAEVKKITAVYVWHLEYCATAQSILWRSVDILDFGNLKENQVRYDTKLRYPKVE